MEITLKIDNLNEINEIKEWFRNKLADTEWVSNQNSYFTTHQYTVTEKYFDDFLQRKIIDLFIITKLVGDDRKINIPDGINISGEIYFPGGVYQNIYDVLFEIYKTLDIVETDDNENDIEIEEKVTYTTDSTFKMPNIKNNKFMI